MQLRYPTIVSAISIISVLGGSIAAPAACPPAPTVNINGNWKGSFITNVDPKTSVSFKLTQSSIGDVTGDWTGGKISGTVRGSTIKYLTLKKTVGCRGTFTGTATISGRTMSFTYTGYNCDGDSVLGQGTATKL